MVVLVLWLIVLTNFPILKVFVFGGVTYGLISCIIPGFIILKNDKFSDLRGVSVLLCDFNRHAHVHWTFCHAVFTIIFNSYNLHFTEILFFALRHHESCCGSSLIQFMLIRK